MSRAKIRGTVLLFALVLICLFIFSGMNRGSASATGRNEILIEAGSGRVLSQSNAHLRLPMASTTKVMTALVAIEGADINDVITVDKRSVGVEGSSIYLKIGDKVTVLELLYGLMLQSGNDAAMTLAHHIYGDYDTFICKMNQKAVELGLKNTNFVNPHGLHHDNHYTTCYDLAMIARCAYQNPIFRKIVSTKDITINGRFLHNKNKMLTLYEGGSGIKTGFTKKAGRCLVSAADRRGVSLIAVVLNCPDMWERSMALFNSEYSKYQEHTLAKAGCIDDVSIIGADNIKAKINEDYKVFAKAEDIKKYSVKTVIREKLILPLKKDTEIGEFQIYYQNRLIFSQKIYTMEDVEEYT